ncbi:MAG: InlB B-repeat-containing protein [Lachnospiraceae bacterium]|nr:InlB B-repeat-containing protein [Lachnospiraceae bacterium]
MKVFKKALPLFMAALMVAPAIFAPVSVYAAELGDAEETETSEEESTVEDESKVQEDVTDDTPTVLAGGSSFEKSWDVGRNDPKEVVATYSDGVLTFTNEYTYDATSGAEELPNPGLMANSTLSEIKDFFNNNDIEGVKVVIGSGVQTVGANALSGCSAITAVQVTSGDFKRFEQGAFSGCSNLASLDMSNGTEVGQQAFANCTNLSSVVLSENTKEICASAFTGVGATTIDIPSSVTSIGEEAFSNSSIKAITGGENVKTVGARAFSGQTTMDVADSASDALKNYDWSGSGYNDINAGGVKQAIITFNTNGGDPIQAVTIAAGDKYTPPTPAYTGMTFEGWFTNSACTTAFVNDSVVEGNLTLYAKWHGDFVTVTIESNNGVASSTQQVAYGGKLTKPSDPAASGDKVFAGWFTDQACTKAFSFDTSLTSNITLYAKWVDATFYDVKFDTDGGSAVETQSIKAGALVTKPTDPTKTDYTFDGWYKTKEYKDKWDFDKDKVSGATTIYARFLSNKVTVKFNTNGGSAIASVVVDRGGKLTNPGNPTKDNSEFLGWYKDDGLTQEFIIDSESINDNMTLYAKWNQTAFTVKWESNGGSTLEPTTANPNALIAKPTDPIKAGYYLVGWCKDSDLKNQWNFDSDKVTADMTLYALWAVGDPATVDGANPGVTNTGAKAPQTGDTSSPLFHLFSGLTALCGAGGAGVAGYAKRKRRLF